MNSRPSLIVIVGSGASCQAGVSDTRQLTAVARKALSEIIVGSSDRTTESSVGTHERTLDGIIDQALVAGGYDDYDFELLLHAIEELEPFLDFNTTLSPRARLRLPLLRNFVALRSQYNSIKDQRSYLHIARSNVLSAIHAEVGTNVEHPDNPVKAQLAREQLARMFLGLADHYRLIVINFNYDDLLDRIDIGWRDGFTWTLPVGQVNMFDPASWLQSFQNNANLLMHVHGSVRFGYPPSSWPSQTRFDEPTKYASLSDARTSIVGRITSGTQVDGKQFDAAYIVSGTQKAGKLVYNTRPYGYYYGAITACLPQADAVLILGYGWRDQHVNGWLSEFVNLHPDAKRAVVTLRTGNDVGDNMTREYRALNGLFGSKWSLIDNQILHSDNTQHFYEDDTRAIAVDGFVLSDANERSLLGFFSS